MKKTFYKIKSDKFKRNIRFLLVSDLHSQDYHEPLRLMREVCADYILFAGDIFEPLNEKFSTMNQRVYPFLAEAARLAPTFYCTGNHEDGSVHSELAKEELLEDRERIYCNEFTEAVENAGIKLLIDEYTVLDGIAFGGLASGLLYKSGVPNLEFLDRFSSLDMPKVLISHHPEYYAKYIRERDIDLTVSGHAHGGQWRFFGRGVFAPGQGLFPRYTAGVHDDRLVISRGLKKTVIPPRIFNPLEIVVIDIEVK